jgi:hypothetical protein
MKRCSKCGVLHDSAVKSVHCDDCRDNLYVDPIVIGEAGVTAESAIDKRRRRDRDRQRDYRAAQKAAKDAAIHGTEKGWWGKNRATILAGMSEAGRAELRELLDHIGAMHDWMEHGHEVSETDEDWFPFEDGLSDVLNSIKEHGITRLHTFHVSDDIPFDWGNNYFHPDAPPYWQNAPLLAALAKDGKPTYLFVRTGWVTALNDWAVYQFLTKRAGFTNDEASQVIGIRVDGNGRAHVDTKWNHLNLNVDAIIAAVRERQRLDDKNLKALCEKHKDRDEDFRESSYFNLAQMAAKMAGRNI